MAKYGGRPLITIGEAAARLAVSRHTIRAWILDGRIGRVKLGRAVRVPANEIERLIDAGLKPARKGVE